jgi:putative transcriptional regulator
VIIYNKLGDYLKSKDMKYIDLQRELQLSPSMTAKFTKNRTMSTDTINKVCEYLQVQPSEIMEWIPDAEYNKANEQIANIDAQIAELMAKKKELQK